jgi:DNA-binding transcriptional regulator YiaG
MATTAGRRASPTVRSSEAARSLDPSPRSGAQVRTLREKLGVTQSTFARLSGCSVRAIAQWESGETKGPMRSQRLSEIDRLQQALSRVMRADFVGEWLLEPNDAFGGLKPLEVIERGEVDRIWRMIYELESGTPS